jgi:hypothetical protein
VRLRLLLLHGRPPQGHLLVLNLAGGGLSCPAFPASLARFKRLQSLDMGHTDIRDTMRGAAQVLAQLSPSLRRLYLRYAGLSGALPCGLPALPQLAVLSLSGASCISACSVAGCCSERRCSRARPCPPTALLLPPARGPAAAAAGNPVTGTLPACYLASRTLRELYVSAAPLSGTLPDIPPDSALQLLFALQPQGTRAPLGPRRAGGGPAWPPDGRHHG